MNQVCFEKTLKRTKYTTELYVSVLKELAPRTYFTFVELWSKFLGYVSPVLSTGNIKDIENHCLNLLAIELNIDISEVQVIKDKHINKLLERIDYEQTFFYY